MGKRLTTISGNPRPRETCFLLQRISVFCLSNVAMPLLFGVVLKRVLDSVRSHGCVWFIGLYFMDLKGSFVLPGAKYSIIVIENIRGMIRN